MEKHHLDANQSSVQLLAFNTNGRNFATFLSPKKRAARELLPGAEGPNAAGAKIRRMSWLIAQEYLRHSDRPGTGGEAILAGPTGDSAF